MSTTTDLQHRPWCADHDNELNECVSRAREAGPAATWAVDVAHSPTIVVDSPDARRGLTPDEARALAAALVRLADEVEVAQ